MSEITLINWFIIWDPDYKNFPNYLNDHNPWTQITVKLPKCPKLPWSTDSFIIWENDPDYQISQITWMTTILGLMSFSNDQNYLNVRNYLNFPNCQNSPNFQNYSNFWNYSKYMKDSKLIGVAKWPYALWEVGNLVIARSGCLELPNDHAFPGR